MPYINNLSIDCVIFGFDEGILKTLLVTRKLDPFKGLHALPGGFVGIDEHLKDAPTRRLKDLTGLDNVYFTEVGTFGDINRYSLKRVITVAYYALTKVSNHIIYTGPDAENVFWNPVKDIPQLVFDHNEIFNAALEKLRHHVRHEPIGFNLLPEKFTLTEMQTLYEAILGTTFDKRNFRKKIAHMNLLLDVKEKQTNVAHRAAKLYSFDMNMYKKLQTKGFIFDL